MGIMDLIKDKLRNFKDKLKNFKRIETIISLVMACNTVFQYLNYVKINRYNSKFGIEGGKEEIFYKFL